VDGLALKTDATEFNQLKDVVIDPILGDRLLATITEVNDIVSGSGFATAASVTALESQMSDADTNIGINATAITGLLTDVSNNAAGISSNSTAITSLQSDLAANDLGIAANSTAIATLQTGVAANDTEIAANTAAITTLQSGLATANTNITANSTAISGILTDVTANQGAIAANSTAITSLQSDLAANDTDVAANSAAITTLQTNVSANAGGIAANAASITAIQSDISGNDTDIAANSAAITTLQTNVSANDNDIAANAASITSIQSTITRQGAFINVNSSAFSGILTDVANNSGDISANSLAITSLTSRVGAVELVNLDSSFEHGKDHWDAEPQATVVNGSGLYGGSVLELVSENSVYAKEFIPVDPGNKYRGTFRVRQTVDPSAGGNLVYAGISCFDANKTPLSGPLGTYRYGFARAKAVTSADGWVTFSDVMTGEGDASWQEFRPGTRYVKPMFIVNYQSGNGVAQVDMFEFDEVTADEAMSSAISSLETDVSNNAFGISSNSTAITTLSGRITTAESDIDGNAGAISTLQTDLAAANGAVSSNASAISVLQTDVATAQGAANAANVTANSAQSTADTANNAASANASSISGLTTTVNSHTASITSFSSSIDGLSAQYTVKVDNNGYVSGFGLASTVVDGVPLSEFAILADKFVIANPGSTDFAPFYVANNTVYMNSAVIKDATITNAKIANLTLETGKIKDNAVSNAVSAAVAQKTMSSASYQTLISISLSTDGGDVYIDFTCGAWWSYSASQFKFRILRDSVVLAEDVRVYSAGQYLTKSMSTTDSPSIGTHTYSLQAAKISGADAVAYTSTLFVLELKK